MNLDQIIFYLEIGFSHIMDIGAYDHLLFLVSISVVYSFKSWKKLFWIVTFFTIGHSMSLVISSYNIYKPNSDFITIFFYSNISSNYNYFCSNKFIFFKVHSKNQLFNNTDCFIFWINSRIWFCKLF